MSLKRVTTPQGDVYFVDSITGQRVVTKMDVIKSSANTETIPQVGVSEIKVLSTEEEEIEELKKSNKWFAFAKNINGEKIIYKLDTFKKEMEKNILEGIHTANDPIELYAIDNKGVWKKTDSTITQFSRSHFNLGVLYRPVWSHATAGLKYGIITGIALKVLDTFIMLTQVDGTTALLFLVAIGVCFIPRIGVIAMVAVGIIFARLTKVNLFIMALAAGLIGAIIGCLPGMAIGGIVGLFRKDNLPKAKDAEPEPSNVIIKSVVLPLICGLFIIWFYIFVFNPWLVEQLS